METTENEIGLRSDRDKKALEETIKCLSNMVNNMSFDNVEAAKAMASQLSRVHRTLQQSTLRLIACFIREISGFDTDLRNEAAIKWAKEVSKIDSYFPFI